MIPTQQTPRPPTGPAPRAARTARPEQITRPARRRGAGAAGPKILLGSALGSIGYGCSLLPSVSLEPLLILIPAVILLMAGLHQSATEDARTPQ